MKKDFDQDELIVRKLTGSLSPREEEAFQEMLASGSGFYEKFSSYQQLWEDAAEVRLPLGLPEEERWKNLNTRLDGRTQKEEKPLAKWYWRYAAIVSFLLLSTAGYLLYSHSNAWETVSATAGGIKTIGLPDQSTVTLNTGSSVKFDPSDWEEERIIYLEGEAYFEVVKNNAPFIVYANEARIVVRGTSFNIKADRSRVQVACTTGKVAVGSVNGDGMEKVLLKGNGIEVSDSRLGDIYAIDVSQVAVWRTGKLAFEETPLPEVFRELELYFGVQIKSERGAGKLSFTGTFNNPELQDVLKTICLSAGLKYEFTGEEQVRIY